MNIFEGFFGSKKEHTATEENEVSIETIESAPALKTVESIQQAKESIAELAEKRQEILEKHRDTAEELAALGVREIEKDGHARTETYNEVLTPIEMELAALSAELGEKRAEFDLEPSRIVMLEERMRRLEDIKGREERHFAETEVGKQIARYDEEISALTKEIAQLGNKRIEGSLTSIGEEMLHEKEKVRDVAQEKKSALYRDDTVAHAHAMRMQRIQEMSANTHFTKKNAEDTSYDENGQMRIK